MNSNWNEELNAIYNDYKIKISKLDEPLSINVPADKIDTLLDMDMNSVNFNNLKINDWDTISFDDDELNETGCYTILITSKYGDIDIDKRDLNNFYIIDDSIFELNKFNTTIRLDYDPLNGICYYSNYWADDKQRCYIHLTPPVKKYFNLMFNKLKTSVSTLYADKNGHIV